MELHKNVYQIQSLYGGRNLFQYLFVGSSTVLVGSGIAKTPEETIFPYLDHLKIKPSDLTLVITTHPDMDHQGGNDAIKRTAPRTLLGCGLADRALVEDPRALFDQRYNYLKEEHEVGFDREPPPDAGKPRKIDICFSGGERIDLADGWSLEVLHVPGHSQGHLALYDRANRSAFVSDAVHGRGCPKADGSMGLPVTYYYVDLYLSTLRYIEGLAIDTLYSGHWPVMHGEEIRDFIAQSRQTVELFDRVILASLEKNHAGLTLKQLIGSVADEAGDWPEDTSELAMFAVKGHLERLEQHGKVRAIQGSRPVKWQKV